MIDLPPGHKERTVSADENKTLSINAPGFTTIRPCKRCGVLISGGPSMCLLCAETPVRHAEVNNTTNSTTNNTSVNDVLHAIENAVSHNDYFYVRFLLHTLDQEHEHLSDEQALKALLRTRHNK